MNEQEIAMLVARIKQQYGEVTAAQLNQTWIFVYAVTPAQELIGVAETTEEAMQIVETYKQTAASSVEGYFLRMLTLSTEGV